MALATDPPSEEVLERPPDSPESGLITYHMKRMIVGMSALHITVLLVIQLAGPRFIAARGALRTFLFNAFIFLQLFNEINCRTLGREKNVFRGILRNKFFIGIWIGTVAIQVLLVQYGGAAFATVPLDWQSWLASVAIGLLSLPVGLGIRLVPDYLKGPIPSPLHPSRGQLRWQAAVRDVQRNLTFFNAIRRAKRRTPSISSAPHTLAYPSGAP